MIRTCVLAAGVLLLLAGCNSPEHDQAVAHQQAVAAGEQPDPGQFHADVSFYWRTTKKKWTRDKDGEFRIRKQSQVRARASFRNAEPGQTYAIHLVWIRPDGKELYRRYAEAVVTPTDSTGYVSEVVYRAANDLVARKTQRTESKKPTFSVESTFDISRDKNRETGEYLLRVYLDRRLLREETVTVVGS